ncbi:hypothetical protein F8388_021262 [Cannabis sativa]|uniref:RNase H type-1 domain-containing protein n=1 Tax=Cannabis sativa TaxID=3483 RepID=A0A7J6GFF7_CANSA|nr:hypothetical protein F8388_021262 [Cannabis sativa]
MIESGTVGFPTHHTADCGFLWSGGVPLLGPEEDGGGGGGTGTESGAGGVGGSGGFKGGVGPGGGRVGIDEGGTQRFGRGERLERFTAYFPLSIIRVEFIPFETYIAEKSCRLNFAGVISDRKSGTAGLGFILRDENGIFKAGCAEPLSNCDNIVTAELTALCHGLEVAMNQGVEYLEIEGDCGIVFEVLHYKIEVISPGIEKIISRCLNFLEAFRHAKITQVPVPRNMAANKMASIGSGEREAIYWSNTPPPEISEIVVADVIGRWVKWVLMEFHDPPLAGNMCTDRS